ncbi:MAG TPA: carbohydrate kinase family protein [Thermoanaerobaculia bacterium]|nr:carbohydrate kinase family protein [Thermoanaerobaculia bacterium]
MSSHPLPIRRPGQVVVCGSIAFDNIMDYPGSFRDHILADKAHVINISFLVEQFKRQQGGCAPNIAYSLALLGERARIVGTAGTDFGDYRDWLVGQGVDVEAVGIVPGEMTATCFITTDRADCQITGFFPGAMGKARDLCLAELAGPEASVAIVAPDDPEAMLRHCQEARAMGLPFFFDASFQVTALDGEPLARAADGALGLFLNDYEFSVFQQKTGKTADQIRAEHELLVITYGEKGSEILLRDGSTIQVSASKVGKAVDPTGAGDAYRGGFLAGLMKGLSLEICARMGSIAAVYCIECYGTQCHAYTRQEFLERYRATYGADLALD